MTEWWQKDESDIPVPVPRRDVVPESGLSDPRDVTSTPELVSFIPEWRAKRRIIAVIVTLVALGSVVMATRGIFKVLSLTCPTARVQGFPRVVFYLVGIIIAGIAVFQTWRWANQRDPRDIRNPIF